MHSVMERACSICLQRLLQYSHSQGFFTWKSLSLHYFLKSHKLSKLFSWELKLSIKMGSKS